MEESKVGESKGRVQVAGQIAVLESDQGPLLQFVTEEGWHMTLMWFRKKTLLDQGKVIVSSGGLLNDFW